MALIVKTPCLPLPRVGAQALPLINAAAPRPYKTGVYLQGEGAGRSSRAKCSR